MTENSFVEVMNQCAKLERLIDILVWIGTVGDLDGAVVFNCNPTTSSSSRKEGQQRPVNDHDLVMSDPSGNFWRFEVSDVAGEDDGNGEEKDLISLGGLPEDGLDALTPCSKMGSTQRLRSPEFSGSLTGTPALASSSSRASVDALIPAK